MTDLLGDARRVPSGRGLFFAAHHPLVLLVLLVVVVAIVLVLSRRGR